MAIIKWKGGAAAVAQVSNGTVDSFDASSTYTVTISDYTVGVAGNTDVATTALDLVAALNGSTHPYFAAITWSSPTSGDVTGTGDVEGAPFSATLSVAGGTGTITNFTTSTAATGPHHVGEVENWEGGALPVATDDVIIDSGTSLLYALDALSAIALASVDIRQSFTNSIGLEPSAFATSLDGQTLDPNEIPEYRGTHLELDSTLITIGEHFGPGTPSGSGRILIDQQKTTASRLVVVNTSSTTQLSKPAVRYLASDADADVDVRLAPGGVGIASDGGDVATVGEVLLADTTSASAVFIGEGCTLTSIETFGGTTQLAAAATVTSVTNHGDMTIGGEGYTITTLNINAGEVVDTHLNTAGVEWGTINLRGGTLELQSVSDASARSWTTCNLSRGRLAGDMSRLSATLTIAIAAGDNDNTAIDLSDL